MRVKYSLVEAGPWELALFNIFRQIEILVLKMNVAFSIFCKFEYMYNLKELTLHIKTLL